MRVLRIAACLFVFTATFAGSQEVVVRKGGSAKKAVDLAGLKIAQSPAAGIFRRTLEADLIRSGWFVLATPGAFSVLGACDDSGGNLGVRCQVFSGQECRLNKSFAETSVQARRLAHKVADEIVMALTGHPGIASTHIVLVGNRSGAKELYICDYDGENLQQVTADRSIILGPHWNPQANQVVYTSFRGGFPDAYVIDLGSRAWRRVAKFPGVNTAGHVAPNGRDLALALSKDGNPEIYVMSLGGGGLTRLTHTSPAGEASPAWSPDGNQIVFVSDTSGSPQLYVMDRSGGSRKRLTSRGSENVDPDWGSNGLITYASKRGKFQICVLDPQTLKDTQITQDAADYETPSWAPDGRHIVCSRTAGYSSSVYVVDTLGDNPIPLGKFGGDWYCPAWSPK